MSYQGYSTGTTKECLTHFTGCIQLRCAAERGIYRRSKHDNRNRKRIQHEQNVANRAGGKDTYTKKGK